MIKIVQCSSNPCGGSPYELNKLINNHSKICTSRFISGSTSYQNLDFAPSREFPIDLSWKENQENCIQILKEADIIHCHNSIFPKNLPEYINSKQKIILQIYSVDREALKNQIEQALSIANYIVIADQPWQKDVYKDLSKDYLPLVKNLWNYSCSQKKIPIITYAPTNKYPSTHIYSKGYNEVLSVINELQLHYNFEFRLIEGVNYEENLKLKVDSDIIIDDIITENAFHGTSLESACLGAIALTNYTGEDYPFIKTNQYTLKNILIEYLKNDNKLQQDKNILKSWQEQFYTADKLIIKYEDYYLKCLREDSTVTTVLSEKELKTKLYHILKDWLDKHNIFHFLSFGSALKAYRDNDWATDTDFGLWYKDRWKVYNLLQSDPPEGIVTNCIWRGEFTFRLKDFNHPKLDFLFFDKKDDGFYHCCLYTRNPFNGLVSWERGMKVSHKTLDNFYEINFANRLINLPKNIELYLDENYKDWRIPQNKSQGWGSRPCADFEHREYAIIIPTFIRFNKMKECVESFLKYYPSDWIRIYVGDQSFEITEEQQNYYNELQNRGHKYIRLPSNCGLSYARNELIKYIKEPYILIIDDDFICTKETDLTKFKNVLESNEQIGIVGGMLNNRTPYLGWLYYNPLIQKIIKVRQDAVPYSILKTKNYPYNDRNISYYYTDIVLNFFLAKREVFNDFQWDNELLLCEHTDAFLRLKETKWKVVYCPEVNITHSSEPNSNEYKNFRSNENKKIGMERFLKKWNLNSLDDIWHVPAKITKDNILPSPQINIVTPEITSNIAPTYSIDQVIKEIFKICADNNFLCVLLKNSLKDVLLNKKLTNFPIIIGTGNTGKLKEVIQSEKFQKVYPNVNIVIEYYNHHTKNWKLENGQIVKVPYPLVAYLQYNFLTEDKLLFKEKGIY